MTKKAEPAPSPQSRLHINTNGYCESNAVPRQLRRRRAASYRCEPLDCGHRDPSSCRCHDDPPTDLTSELQVDAYRDTAVMLLGSGLSPGTNVPAMRVLWRRGGWEQRLVQTITLQWEVAA